VDSRQPHAKQPWDRADFVFPAPAPGTTDARDMILVGCAMLYKKTAGAFESPKLAINALYEAPA